MTAREELVFSLAVIADAHFHDIEGDYGVPGIPVDHRKLTLHTWAHSRESTRVYNESAGALTAALAEVAERGIRHVVLLGDYTDDGQRRTTESLARRLAAHEARFGTRFYALPGNHDMFGPQGRHQSRYFLCEDGSRILVTSDGRDPVPGSVVTPGMYCDGYPDGLKPMARHGYFRRPEDLHWETPFGMDDAPDARTYEVASPDGQNRYRLMDASYLVEPEEGLWLLMIDANVFEPRDGVFRRGSKRAFIDSTAAGWNAMLRVKPFIFDWIRGVHARAEAAGKTVLAFSHYPAIDPFDDPSSYERTLFPDGSIAGRLPAPAVAEALIAAGVSLHFSGHWHVEGVSRRECGGHALTNVAVPSLVGFPPGFKQIAAGRTAVEVETVNLSALPLDAGIVAVYRREAENSGELPDIAFQAETYGAFLRAHTRSLVTHRYFPREWPKEVVTIIASMTLTELLNDERTKPAGASHNLDCILAPEFGELAVTDLVADWYCLRQGGQRALAVIGKDRINLLDTIANLYAGAAEMDVDRFVQAYLVTFFRAALHFLDHARLQEDGHPA